MFMPAVCMFTSELIIQNGVFKEEQEGTLSVVVVNELLYKQEVRMHERFCRSARKKSAGQKLFFRIVNTMVRDLVLFDFAGGEIHYICI